MFCVLKKNEIKKDHSDRRTYALKINLQCSAQSYGFYLLCFELVFVKNEECFIDLTMSFITKILWLLTSEFSDLLFI